MNWTIEFVESLDLIKVIYEGKCSVEDSIRAKQAYLSSEYWRPGINVLVDFRQVIFDFTRLDELRKSVRFNAENQDKYGSSRIAYVVKSQRDFGVVRQIKALMECYTETKVMPFMEESEAINWLEKERVTKIAEVAEQIKLAA